MATPPTVALTDRCWPVGKPATASGDGSANVRRYVLGATRRRAVSGCSRDGFLASR